MPEKFHIHNESNIPPEVAKQLRKHFKESAIEAVASKEGNALLLSRENMGLINEALGEGAADRIGMSYQYIFEMLAGKGISLSQLDPVLLHAEETPGSSGHSSLSHIEIADVHIHDTNLRQLATLKLLAHELYHSIGNYAFAINTDKNESGQISTITAELYASGASYGEAMGKSALEEGAAVIFENEAFEKIKTLFPSEAVNEYDSLIEQAKKKQQERTPDIYDGTVMIRKLNESKEVYETVTNDYTPSYRLVMYLRSQIPDFDRILEKLRVQRYPLDLAREMEKKFGKGMFNRLVTCKTNEAQALLEELQLKELSA